MSERAYVREVGLRDGLQSIAEVMPTEQKIAWLEAEFAAGVREIEVSSFVPPKLLPQLADAEAVVRHALSLPGLTVSALIPNFKGAERGLALGVHEMNFVLSVSDGHNRSNVRRSTAELVEDFRRVVALCHDAPEDRRPKVACGLATAFGCTIEGRGRRGPGAPHRRRGSPRRAPTRSSSPTRSAMANPARSSACSAA